MFGFIAGGTLPDSMVWSAVQSNGATATFTLTQAGRDLKGIARNQDGSMNGEASGQVNGDQIVLEVFWNTGSIGEYFGTFHKVFFLPGFRLFGSSFDRIHPESQATWFSTEEFFQGEK